MFCWALVVVLGVSVVRVHVRACVVNANGLDFRRSSLAGLLFTVIVKMCVAFITFNVFSNVNNECSNSQTSFKTCPQ